MLINATHMVRLHAHDACMFDRGHVLHPLLNTDAHAVATTHDVATAERTAAALAK